MITNDRERSMSYKRLESLLWQKEQLKTYALCETEKQEYHAIYDEFIRRIQEEQALYDEYHSSAQKIMIEAIALEPVISDIPTLLQALTIESIQNKQEALDFRTCNESTFRKRVADSKLSIAPTILQLFKKNLRSELEILQNQGVSLAFYEHKLPLYSDGEYSTLCSLYLMHKFTSFLTPKSNEPVPMRLHKGYLRWISEQVGKTVDVKRNIGSIVTEDDIRQSSNELLKMCVKTGIYVVPIEGAEKYVFSYFRENGKIMLCLSPNYPLHFTLLCALWCIRHHEEHSELIVYKHIPREALVFAKSVRASSKQKAMLHRERLLTAFFEVANLTALTEDAHFSIMAALLAEEKLI
ncbi:hypothetical protein A374_14050 [Fictibacillus macauensis ZFHKF-1]|uniref:Uncharacterized protein n=1 Tax=Fictibacillus macauensis ZFHKF-1 TaxID=1196324 RepID=I8UD17_9BACL|nr:hypothetical protein [Fictibacillus macauensis]EIT84820.1 hypothetical protein A374_14050 [Fictibacillus macauensis ZFHKF-1]